MGYSDNNATQPSWSWKLGLSLAIMVYISQDYRKILFAGLGDEMKWSPFPFDLPFEDETDMFEAFKEENESKGNKQTS